jgi:hypothetical protein
MTKVMSRLRIAREQGLGLTRAEFAAQVERQSGEPCDERMVWRWEQAGVKPRPARLRAIAAITGLSTGELGWANGEYQAHAGHRPDSSTATHLSALVQRLRVQDDIAPTGSLLAPAATLATLAEQLTAAARDRDQGDLGRASAEAMALHWWLTVDAGLPDQGPWDRALSAAIEWSAPSLVGYLLSWRARLVLGRGDAPDAIRLSVEGRHPRWSLSPGAIAWSASGEARARMLTGGIADARHALDVADEAYAAIELSEEPPWLYWLAEPIRTLDALDMRLLREGANAIPAMEVALQSLSSDRIRDLAWYRARIALARVRSGDFSGATVDAADAAKLSAATGTMWTLAELRQLALRPELKELAEALHDNGCPANADDP